MPKSLASRPLSGCPARGRRVGPCCDCRKVKTIHARGLCLACYQSLRRTTALTPETRGEIALDAFVRTLPVRPVGDLDVPPPPDPVPDTYAPHGPFARRREASAGWRSWERAAGGTHPDTDPERVREDQRGAVLQALRELGPGATAATISAAVILPVWTVERRLAEIAAGES